jgi:hypothetical protein
MVGNRTCQRPWLASPGSESASATAALGCIDVRFWVVIRRPSPQPVQYTHVWLADLGAVKEQRTMGWPLSAWQEQAENLDAHFWRPAQGNRRIARACWGNAYVEVDLFLHDDLINELIPPRASIPETATREVRAAITALASWRP